LLDFNKEKIRKLIKIAGLRDQSIKQLILDDIDSLIKMYEEKLDSINL